MISAHYSLGAPSLMMTLAALLYMCGVARAWRKAGVGRGISWGRALAGLFGFITLAIALSPPLEAIAALFFSGHMAQHLLLVLVAAPLLVAGVPLLALLWLLPPSLRRKSSLLLKRNRPARGVWGTVTHPLIAWSTFVLLLLFWHLPRVYQGAIASDTLHVLEHLSLTGAAALFWWVLLQPLGRRRLERLAAPLYLFLAAVQGGVLGAMITLSPRPWYGYYERVARAEGFSAMADQQLAGLLMWIPPSSLYLGVACWMLYRGLSRAQAKHGDREPRPLAHLNALLPFGLALSLLTGVAGHLTSL